MWIGLVNAESGHCDDGYGCLSWMDGEILVEETWHNVRLLSSELPRH